MIAAETRGFVHRARRVPARAWFWLAVPAFLAVAIPFPASAQTTLSLDGVVLAPTGDPVSGASVGIDGREPVVTDENGRFSIAAEAGERELRVTHPAYQMVRYPITVGEESLELELRFEAATSVEETITVIGIRAGDEVPVTKRNLDREEIETLSYGQDIPALLQYTPAMTWYSDSGVGSNYSYFSMRGIQQSRINMTFDGAPLNDPAEHAVYFNNFHDFANTVDSIQIQRGVGTSSVGSPSYGGSVNFASGPASPARDGDLRLVLGSYETKRASVAYESGVFDNGISVSGRFSYADTEGYRDNSGTKQRTLFFNTGWQGERSSLKLVS
ncbi:MAG: TonB-dependent receptor plug domain-containing protein, partial [Thermoanaerobaculia bacterium]